MKTELLPQTLALLALLFIKLIAQPSTAHAQSTAFSYQGRLNENSGAANGAYDFEFSLCREAVGGAVVAGPVAVDDLVVANGLFTASVDFGEDVFDGEDRWLEIAVRPGASIGSYTVLTPRQKITPAPLAAWATRAGTTATVSGSVAASQISGMLSSNNIAPGSITPPMLANGAAAANLAASGLSALPATALVLSDLEVNQNLLDAGFVPVGLAMTNSADAWTTIPDGPPAPGQTYYDRSRHAAVWVTNFNSMFIFGGYPNRAPLHYHLSSNVWTTISTTNAPTAYFHLAVAWTGSRILIWDTYARSGGRYDPSNDTWQAMSTVNAPSSRSDAASVWTGSRLLVWGGADGPFPPITGASYNPVTDTWQAISTNGAPAGRGGAAAAWTGTEMIVYGGFFIDGDINTPSVFNTGGRYNPNTDTWTSISTNGSPWVQEHQIVWTGSRMVLLGGRISTALNFNLTNGFSYDPVGNSWSQIAHHPVLDKLAGHNLVWSGTHVLVWGGQSNPNGARYTPATDTWTILPAPGTQPRKDSSAVWTASDLICWGGEFIPGDETADGRRYNFAANTWTGLPIPVGPGEPAARNGNTAIWTGDQLIIWGGNNVGVDFRTGGIYRPGVGWTNTPTDGAPSARSGHSAVWTGTEMIVWGGADGLTVNSGARFNVASNQWLPTSLINAPTARRDHSAVWTGSEMIIWGGYQTTNLLDATFLNTGASYNPVTDTWSTNFPVNPIVAGRANHTAVWTGTEMIVWGGYSRTGPILSPTFTYYPNGARYSPGTNALVQLPFPPAGNARTDHTAVWTGTEMLIWGGRNSNGATNSGLRFNPATSLWTALATNGAPAARSAHTAVWTGEFMIIYGGLDNPLVLNTAGYFDPWTDKWYPAPAGIARHEHVAAWTGSEMLTGNGRDNGADPLATWRSFRPAQVFHMYQKP